MMVVRSVLGFVLAVALLSLLGAPALAQDKDVSPGEANGAVDPADGSISLEMDGVALYSVFVGNDAAESLGGTDALVFDGGADTPVWANPFSGQENNVNSPIKETFGELMMGDFLAAQLYDTAVNVNFEGLTGDATTIWLKYQLKGNPGQMVPLYKVPEPGTLAMLLGTGLLGLVLAATRRRRAA